MSLDDEPEERLGIPQGAQVVVRVVDGKEVIVFGIDVADEEGRLDVLQQVEFFEKALEGLERAVL